MRPRAALLALTALGAACTHVRAQTAPAAAARAAAPAPPLDARADTAAL